MGSQETSYILGAGAIGCPWAVFLAEAGRAVVAVRTSRHAIPSGTSAVTVQHGANRISPPVATISLAQLRQLDGTLVIASTAYANDALAQALQDQGATGPVVILQNGVGVEPPFLAAQYAPLYRGGLDVTSQATAADDCPCRAVTASPIGTINGSASGLEPCVAAVTTDGVPCRVEANRHREVWKTAIITAVFNSICPLLEVDPGVFAREEGTAQLAREVVRACVTLTDRLALGLSEQACREHSRRISQGSDGQWSSTRQDIHQGSPTELAWLNLAIARIAASRQPGLQLPRIAFLGNMIVATSLQSRSTAP